MRDHREYVAGVCGDGAGAGEGWGVQRADAVVVGVDGGAVAAVAAEG